jgi:hypothetical protein
VLVGVPFFVIVANVIYTFGWLSELAIRRRTKEGGLRFRAIAFYSGLAFSVLIMTLPLWIALVHLVRQRN